jgi:hypothetical protein
MAPPEHILSVVRETLSDGSEVFNVHLGNIRLPAIDEREARKLAEKIADAINEHTTQSADVEW